MEVRPGIVGLPDKRRPVTARRAPGRTLGALVFLPVKAPVGTADPAIRVRILPFGTVNGELG